MLKKYPQFSFGFAIVFVFHLIAVANRVWQLVYLTKPLITVLLILFVIRTLKYRGRFSTRITIGLAFSLIGDLLLMFKSDNDLFFIGGLVSFLIAHLFYVSAFIIDYRTKTEQKKSNFYSAIAIVCAFSIGYYIFLFPHLGDMKIPVLIYCFVITLMAIMAFGRYGKCNLISFNYIVWGAILFMLSDSLLAYNKFVAKHSYLQLAVMATYMAAQFLITMGTVERKYKKDSKNNLAAG